MSLMPQDQGLYEARREHDACGIGAVVNIYGKKDNYIKQYADQVLKNLHHRGAAGADNVTGDGGGILCQIPHDFLKVETKKYKIKLPNAGA
jgi:glutamate synthase (NADPH/NADH) large chain